MGEVWLATARGPGGFQKRVVIKTVLPDLMEKPTYVQMLVTEASLAARLDHPNIVHVFDLGCVGGMYFIAMEYLSGRSLAQMLRRSHDLGQRLPLRVLLTMIATSCEGLQYAHDYADDDGHPLGLLHRDISPSNIMLTFAGRVALLDFGVATAARGRFKTRSGTIKGKFHYLAPERVRGEEIDRRSDVYSLGVVLYQCLTLRWPFRAQNEYDLLRQIAQEMPPPVRHYAPWVTGRLEQIIMRAMANDPNVRHQQARDLASDLRDYLRAIGAVVEPSELASCLAGLFPEAPEAAAHRKSEAPPLLGESEEGDGIEIVFHPSEAIAAAPDGPLGGPEGRGLGSPLARSGGGPPGEEVAAAEQTELDQPDPVVPALGSPVPSAPAAAIEERSMRRPVPRPRPFANKSDVDIFPEPTRTIAPLGGDVFAGYATRASRYPRATTAEPAFTRVRSEPQEAASAWPWARSVERAESSAEEVRRKRGEPEEPGREEGWQDGS